MKINVEVGDFGPYDPARVGNVYPIKGGRGLRDRWCKGTGAAEEWLETVAEAALAAARIIATPDDRAEAATWLEENAIKQYRGGSDMEERCDVCDGAWDFGAEHNHNLNCLITRLRRPVKP